jgi:ABC-2 type transport system ATP-binding protein
MLQRFGIAQALIHEPELLIIDEPTSGLDPAGQLEMIDLLSEIRSAGHTVLMCTHQVAEVQRLADRMGILAGGRMAAEASLKDLADASGVTVTVSGGTVSGSVVGQLTAMGAAVDAGGRIRIGVGAERQRAVLRLLLDEGFAIAELSPGGTAVEELYWKTTRGAALPGEARVPAAKRGSSPATGAGR